MTNPKIAVIPGDGIGKEVMPEGVRALEAAAKKFGIQFQFDHFDFASCDYYQQHGKMMPDNWFDTLMKYDAIFFGAVGMPNILPDHLSLWGSLIQFRRGFDQYVNLRPVRLLPGVPCPLANRKPGDIDFFVVRENTEGEYSAVGGKMFADTDREIVVQESVFSRHGVDRILKFAYELAQSRPKKHLTSATKSNGIAITMPYWDERVEAMAKNYADVRTDKYHIDILTAQFVMNPDRFDVVVASNLFGDILSDLGPACTGTIAVAPSASINPEGKFPSLFEPVHGSAPDIYGKNIANPIGQIWSGALMLDHLGYPEAGARVFEAIESVLSAGPAHAPLTPDIGGKASTQDLGKAIAAAI
ncbi:MAG: tartrate dehydrogenase [Polynucleobacter sp.]|nr:tartrate dehydrogenase [Burkholderiaceae bacterium]NCY12903.1 tartrate dehydrogenase [Burkholderiaceae bacterium]NDA16512.1 tartrate dehydrogenase [Burkholderiaceae bacterium]NDC21250.1 tartrate dehydrogenase [Burkholderiaceae bacterium]NDC50219.1 tartrate dehydrogenase [Burkholderiaceae bacterium]